MSFFATGRVPVLEKVMIMNIKWVSGPPFTAKMAWKLGILEFMRFKGQISP